MEHESESEFSFLVREEEKGQRIDAFLPCQGRGLSRSRVQDLIKKGLVSVNGSPRKPSYRLREGDLVALVIPELRPCNLEPEPIEFTLIHEDSFLLVLNKPAGLVTHPAPGHPNGTLVHGLLQHCRDLSGVGGVLRPGIVHRLDKDTSGLMVVAKNDRAHAFLSSQFKSGQVRKRYLALVHGVPQEGEGTIHLPIARHPARRKEMTVVRSGGKTALTRWEKMEALGRDFTLLGVRPRTGRTHQIRVHLSHVGHPIIGDPVYGYRKTWWRRHFPEMGEVVSPAPRQMLHAETLGFVHPETGDYSEFHAPMPADMTSTWEALRLMIDD